MGTSATPNVYEALLAAQRARAEKAQAEANEPGVLGTALDYLNRPYSAVVGTLKGIAEGEDWTNNVEKALTGQEHYGAADLLVAAGADPESNYTKWGGLALDIFPGGFIDPLTPLTFGLNKVGKAAKIAGNLPTRLMDVGHVAGIAEDVPDLVAAAKAGQWGPSYLGVSLAPRVVSEQLAKAVQGAGDYIKGRAPVAQELGAVKRATSAPYRTLRPLFGGKRKTYDEYFADLTEKKLALSEDGIAAVNQIKAIGASKSPETRELMTHFIEQPILMERALAGDQRISYAVPKDMSEPEWRAFLDEMLPYAKAAQTPDEAYRDTALSVLPDLGKTLMNNPIRKFETVRLSQFAKLFPGGTDAKEVTENVLNTPELRELMAKELGADYTFEAILRADDDVKDPANALLRYLNQTKTAKGRQSTNGTPWLSADELLQGKKKDPWILVSRQMRQEFAPPVRVDKLKDEDVGLGSTLQGSFLAAIPKVGTPGISEVADPYGGAMRYFVHRDNKGEVTGFLDVNWDAANNQTMFQTMAKEGAKPRAIAYEGPNVWVRPDARKQGIATQLFDFAKQKGVQLGELRYVSTSDSGHAFLTDWLQKNRKNTPHEMLPLIEKLAKFSEQGGNLRDWQAVKGLSKSPKLKTIWEAMNDAVYERSAQDLGGKAWGKYSTLSKEWALLRAHGDKAMEWQWKHATMESLIGEKVDELNRLNLPTAPDAPFSIVDHERKAKLIEELDALRAEQRDPALFGRAAKLRETLDKAKRPATKLNANEERILELGAYSPEAVAKAAEAVEEIRPLLGQIGDMYKSRGVQFGRDQSTYVQHFLKGLVRQVYDAPLDAAKRIEKEGQFKKALMERMAMESPWLNAEEIARRVEIEVANNRSYFARKPVGTGKFDPLVHRREYDVPILVYNAIHPDKPFETDMAKIASEEYRVASNWSWGYDAYKHLIDKYAGKFARKITDPKQVPDGWAKIDYHVPGDPAKNPFNNWYAPKDLIEAMKGGMKAVKEFSSDEGTQRFMEILHGARRWWSAWTLGVFPAYHMRNLAGNITLAQVAGVDLKTPLGMKAWAAGFGAISEKRGEAALQGWADQLNAVYGVTEFSPEKLRRLMKAENIMGIGVRDFDWENHGDEINAILKESFDKESKKKKLLRWIHPDYRKNTAIKIGFDAARKIDDLGRATVFLHRLMTNSSATTDVTRAIREAVAHTKTNMYDYSDLTAFESNIAKLAVPFYCVPTSHEILTREGWKTHDQLRIGEDVMTYDAEGGNLRWEPLLDVARFDFDGKLKKISRKSGEWLCTEDHRWPVEVIKTKVKGKWYGGERKILRTHELNTTHKIPLTGDYQEQSSILSPRHAAILGWVVTDGYYRWRKNYCEMLVYQHPRKFLKEIETLLESTRRKAHPDTGVCPVAVRRKDVEILTRVFRAKGDLPRIVGKLSRESADAMYDAMMKAEGCKSSDGQEFFAQCPEHNPDIRDAFQMLALMTGRSANMNGRGLYIRKQKHLWAGQKNAITDVDYKGQIWCPKTPSGTWVMRNEGSTIITGNTFTAKNTPHMISEFIRQPGKFQYLNRAYHGAWSGYDEELEPEDLPDFMQKDLRVPFAKAKNGEYVMFTGRGWFPAAELMELAQMFTEKNGMAQYFISRVNPVFKTPLELAMNRNSFTGEEINEPGRVKDLMSVIAGPAWMRYSLENIRLLTELDRLNPGGVFTTLGKMRGLWGDERPHRNEAPGVYRALQSGFGLNFKDVEPVESLRKQIGKLGKEINGLKTDVRYAVRNGQWAERDRKLEEINKLVEQQRALAERMTERQRYTAAHLNGNG